MRTIFLVPVGALAAAAALSISGPAGPPGPPPAPESRLERAARILDDASRSREDVGVALRDLLEETIATAPETDFPGDWRAKAARARDLIVARSPVDAEARRLLEESWSAAFGSAWAFPAAVATIDDATALARRNVRAAAKARREGRPAEEVRLLLETVLVVVTPMHAPAGRS